MGDRYTIAMGLTAPELVSVVNGLMSEGWTPTGGLWAGTTFGSKVGFFQAMVRPNYVEYPS